MKHFVDIEHIKESATTLSKCNTGAFWPGDIIQITEKVDGSNASIQYVDGELKVFSRRQELTPDNTLDGFYDYVKSLDPAKFSDTPNLVIFGEWLRKNKIIYEADNMHKWYVYDIFDLTTEQWMPQDFVKDFCKKHDLIYVHVLYEGPFISWDHCKTFMHSPMYGDRQEGIVIKNQTKLNEPIIRDPVYLKIVNDDFKETQKQKAPKSAEQIAAGNEAMALALTIITERRVEKMIFALRDDGIFPETFEAKDMKLVAQHLPRRVYEDCLKEEPETVAAVDALGAQPFGKICGSIVMKMARNLIIGGK